MTHDPKISLSLLIMRLSIAAFFGAWTSLKFTRPEWFENVFQNFYGLSFVSGQMAAIVGGLQLLLLLVFVLGVKRTISYGIMALMQAAGVLASIPNLMNLTQYPNNLMWAAVPALGCVVGLFLLRNYDRYTVDGLRGTPAQIKA